VTLIQEREQELKFCAARTAMVVAQGNDAAAQDAGVALGQAYRRWLELPMLTSCAWCRKVLQDGRTAPDGHGSHGICPACFELEKELW
jgi:hypothetical protein